jgi:two-component system, NtrC family, response regulator HydG
MKTDRGVVVENEGVRNQGLDKKSPSLFKQESIKAEYKVVLRALEKTNFNKTKAAKLLGVERKTIMKKINDYNALK